MTWEDLKELIENKGMTNQTQVDYIDIDILYKEEFIVVVDEGREVGTKKVTIK